MRLIIFNEKHEPRYFRLPGDAGSEQETLKLQSIALKVFRERDADDWYEYDELTETQKRYYDKAKDGDTKAALTFLNSRQDSEYEGFEIVTPEEV